MNVANLINIDPYSLSILRHIFYLPIKTELIKAVAPTKLSLLEGDLKLQILVILNRTFVIVLKTIIMNSAQETGRSSFRSEETKKALETYNSLSTDEKLALLYYIYKKMGDSITPAAPTAANPEMAPQLLGEFYQLSDEQQLSTMREIVNREDTELSRSYGGLTENNQLVVWYAWAIGMGDTVVDMPPGYEASQSINKALSQIESLDFEGQISTLREIAGNMGYSEVKPIPTQAETGKTASL